MSTFVVDALIKAVIPVAEAAKSDLKGLAAQLADETIRRIAARTLSEEPATASAETSWKLRAALADAAEHMRHSADFWDRRPAGRGPQAKRLLRSLFNQLQRKTGRAASKEGGALAADLRPIIERLDAFYSEKGALAPDAAKEMAGVLENVALYLKRASAVIWDSMLVPLGEEEWFRGYSIDPKIHPKYLSELIRFAEVLGRLEPSPTFPVGEQGPAEADAICTVLQFVRERHRYLRTWVNPSAAYQYFSGNYWPSPIDGESLYSAGHQLGTSDGSDAVNWTLRHKQVNSETLAEPISALMQWAEDRGVDFDAALKVAKQKHAQRMK